MIYLQLFVSFMKIGFTSFGGMSMVPLILEEMSSHGWMTAEDLANLVAIAHLHRHDPGRHRDSGLRDLLFGPLCPDLVPYDRVSDALPADKKKVVRACRHNKLGPAGHVLLRISSSDGLII